MVANRTTDFNPDWIGMIVLLVSELVKLQHQFELKWLAMASKVWEHGLRPTNGCAQQGVVICRVFSKLFLSSRRTLNVAHVGVGLRRRLRL